MSGFKLMLTWQGTEREKCPRCKIEFDAAKPDHVRSSGDLYDLAVVFYNRIEGEWQQEVIHQACVKHGDHWMPASLSAKDTWIG